MLQSDPAISPASYVATTTTHPAISVALLADLAVRLSNFDEDAAQDFLLHFEKPLRNLFLRGGIPAHEVEDLACVCIEKAILNIRQYHPLPGKSFADWVFMIAYNRLKDWARRKATRPQTDLSLEDIPPNKLVAFDVAPDVPNDEESEMESPSVTAQAVQDALSRLSPTDQEIIRLRYFDYVTDNAELAQRLDIKVNAAKTRLSRAMHKLKPLLMEDPRIKLTKH
ncbi:MAG: RNA polymerase sigma factor [Acidobacteria bacterium]|nr:RNA polymerase sigma factor [Acidobacteriota bacterium]